MPMLKMVGRGNNNNNHTIIAVNPRNYQIIMISTTEPEVLAEEEIGNDGQKRNDDLLPPLTLEIIPEIIENENESLATTNVEDGLLPHQRDIRQNQPNTKRICEDRQIVTPCPKNSFAP